MLSKFGCYLSVYRSWNSMGNDSWWFVSYLSHLEGTVSIRYFQEVWTEEVMHLFWENVDDASIPSSRLRYGVKKEEEAAAAAVGAFPPSFPPSPRLPTHEWTAWMTHTHTHTSESAVFLIHADNDRNIRTRTFAGVNSLIPFAASK